MKKVHFYLQLSALVLAFSILSIELFDKEFNFEHTLKGETNLCLMFLVGLIQYPISVISQFFRSLRNQYGIAHVLTSTSYLTTIIYFDNLIKSHYVVLIAWCLAILFVYYLFTLTSSKKNIQ